jgi:uncharacterized membrane protein YphA (DoxX/SURF4 family)
MFFAYPDGWPGLGLLLLRAAAGSVLVVQGITFYQEGQNLGLPILTMAAITVLVGVLLLMGLVTRYATAVAALGTITSMFSWFPGTKAGVFETRSTAILALVIGAAIASVGPGAFSVDARLFGRRELIIPKRRDDSGDDTRV